MLNMNRFLTLFLLLTIAHLGWSQGFTNWIVGDTSDVTPANYLPGLVLAGGAGDNDEAMQWMLERADGGDVLVIRASSSDGYNDYFFSELGVSVNSVETIRFDGPAAASDPYVLRRIQEAEVLFIAGGDQYDYYEYWKDNAVEEAIQGLLLEKGVTVGGTSAGMAILGHGYYTPSGSGIVSDEALGNAYHPFMNVTGYGDFLTPFYMQHTITDTHFDQRNRAGRSMAFLARLTHEFGFQARGIAANEYTAVCIDETGLARVFGEYPEYEEDQIYFMRVNCAEPYGPEEYSAGDPIHWYRNEEAVKVYRVPATIDGNHTFDLSNWLDGNGGMWEDWYIDQGVLVQSENATPPGCEATATVDYSSDIPPVIAPNPFSDQFEISWPGNSEFLEVILTNSQGQMVFTGRVENGGRLRLEGLPAGLYYCQIQSTTEVATIPVSKVP
jgi:cyanophycinase-like exopeptidase